MVGVSLLDRLVDLDPKTKREARPYRVQSLAAYKESIRRDLTWLLSTRAPRRQKDLEREQRTVIDYGIPDFSDYYTANAEDWRKIAESVERSIRVYEPRLKNVRVKVLGAMAGVQVLPFVMEAEIWIEGKAIPVAFPIEITGKGESVVITLQNER